MFLLLGCVVARAFLSCLYVAVSKSANARFVLERLLALHNPYGFCIKCSRNVQKYYINKQNDRLCLETTLDTGHSKRHIATLPIFENIIDYKVGKERNIQTENSPNDPQHPQASMQIVFQNQCSRTRFHFERHEISNLVFLVASSTLSLVHGIDDLDLQLNAFAGYHPVHDHARDGKPPASMIRGNTGK